jgi:adenosylcobyric acid synthase
LNAFIGLPDTRIRYVNKGEAIGDVDMIIIPGTKNTVLDLVYLQEEGYYQEILELAKREKYVIGICGGYQMLGQELHDPEGTEAGIGSQTGLGLLPCITTFGLKKSCHQVEAQIMVTQGIWKSLRGQMIRGYEIHMGHSHVYEEQAGLMEINYRSGQEVSLAEGACDASGRIFGTYLHGIFDNANIMLALMNNIRKKKGLIPLEEKNLPIFQKENRYDRLAEVVRNSVDMEQIAAILNAGGA